MDWRTDRVHFARVCEFKSVGQCGEVCAFWWASGPHLDWEHEHSARWLHDALSVQRRANKAAFGHEDALRNFWSEHCQSSHCQSLWHDLCGQGSHSQFRNFPATILEDHQAVSKPARRKWAGRGGRRRDHDHVQCQIGARPAPKTRNHITRC